MSELSERIKNTITTQRLLKRGERVVVAVSGGVDSMVLLHILHGFAPSFGWKLIVAHFNHHLRGKASDGDERFVCAAARRLGLACDVGRADVRRQAERDGVSIEMAARELRHAFLTRCARKRKARTAVLAQHADDQVELFLLRLLRGAGGTGLGGMRARSVSPADRKIVLVRPLLECFKVELEEYARECGIRFREDASNESIKHDRNWVRLELLPLLRQRHPAAAKALLRTMRITQAESDFVLLAAGAWLTGLRRSRGGRGVPFADLHVAAQRQILQAQLLELDCEPDFQLIEHLRLHPGKPASFATGWKVVRDTAGAVSKTESRAMEYVAAQAVVEFSPALRRPSGSMRGRLEFGGLTLNWRILRRPERLWSVRKAGREFFDADWVGAHLLLRHWRPGDRFQPIGLTSPTKLQDWFVNRKIPAARRRRLVMAENERGELFWVEGERVAEACKITPATRRVLELRWKRP